MSLKQTFEDFDKTLQEIKEARESFQRSRTMFNDVIKQSKFIVMYNNIDTESKPTTAPDLNYLFQKAESKCEILNAIMTLEYHNMTYLSQDPATRNQIQRELVFEIMCTIRDIKNLTI